MIKNSACVLHFKSRDYEEFELVFVRRSWYDPDIFDYAGFDTFKV